ncbi:phospholipase D-like domain-containing protein [Leptospira bandrabouensis]|uniref:phospholipase D family protein n=1 Tax=Leptospira bandrabouensis TaxID=2484903 RepID=UPI00223CE3FB|nr:phospholipase D-like domain-containing protein [Leptospira bandrabouensis]MCW7479370.1 phospholipase D-like domain-containing protein [Leptospira bandrabouensis]MCW7487050.1 phospholipase D-like domain-containing protein [Leptospira bandrabouensis]
MKLLFDTKSKRQLAVLLKFLPENISKIYAAIAYTKSDLLINTCILKKIKLEWWGLFDSKESTSYDLIKKAISSEHVRFYPFAEYFHPKVIYFENFGVYIGSANMTNNALYNNVEAGIFIEETELSNADKDQILSFFEYLKSTSIPVALEDIEKIDKFLELTILEREGIEKYENNIEENFEEHLSHLFLLTPGVRDFDQNKSEKKDKRKLLFLQEWRETQNYLNQVKTVIKENCQQPNWIDKNANLTIITDQLLHAFYYSYILKGNEDGSSMEKVQNSYKINKNNPHQAIIDAIRWWETLVDAPSGEDKHINEWGVINEKILKKLENSDLNFDEFHTIIKQNHAGRNHARQIKNEFFNLPTNYKTDYEERVNIFAKWLFNQKSKNNLTINEVLRYLLFAKSPSLEDRIYSVLYDEQFRIERLGKSIVGELVGWGRPDLTHLRNNRVNKALRCLGFDVRLFSE